MTDYFTTSGANRYCTKHGNSHHSKIHRKGKPCPENRPRSYRVFCQQHQTSPD